ncbi:MAG: RidA family protein [candidate division Zixibacteria bacterium]|nr:RidA family protein [candidate division Zixibacteria bacterium]
MKEVIKTAEAPAAIGPYSQGIAAPCGKIIFIAGQIAINPKSGELVNGGIVEQTKQVLENIKAILTVSGAKMEDVVKTTVFLPSLDDFTLMNETYARYFPANPPARSTVEVGRLPRGAKVEIEAVAVLQKK